MASAGVNELEGKAQGFATQVSEVVSAFLDKPIPFEATGSESRFVIRDTGGKGVVIRLAENAHLTLELEYRCEMDREGKFLKVLNSKLAVHAGQVAKGDPLFRYEYVHNQGSGLPASHLHVHAHRDHFTRVMTLASVAGAKRRKVKPDAELEAARLSKLHFPTGGHRFRPGLEDVLQMIKVEFGVKPGPSWVEVRDRNRMEWRRRQTAAAVRDCPSEAVRVLRRLGYHVIPPEGGEAPANETRLTAF